MLTLMLSEFELGTIGLNWYLLLSLHLKILHLLGFIALGVIEIFL